MKSKLLILLTVAVGLILMVNPVAAQTVHPVYAGENTLYDAIQAAASGDIIELMDSGGDYVYTLDSDKIEIDKTLTIRALEGLAERPVIRNDRASGSTSTRNFEIISGSGGLTLIGIEFDGSRNGARFSKQAIRVNVGDSSVVNLKIDDCYFHDYTENFLRGYLKTVIDTFIVRNTISTGADREGWNLYDTGGDGPAMNYVLFENVTISNVGREAIQFGSAAVGYNPEVIINHVTMDSTALVENDRVIRMSAGTIDVTNATITNSIISNQMGSYQESVDLFGTSTIAYTDTFNARPVDNQESSTIGIGMIDADPMYTDAANGDFTPMAGSAIIGAADDGYNLGDLRWDELAQGPTIHRVYAGENTLYDAVVAAADGDIIELMDNGGDYVYTMDSDKIEIDKTLTIRAREGLTERPVIRNDRASGSTSTRNLEVIGGSGVTLIGLEFDGTREGARFSKQAMRVNVGDSSSVNIKIYDCYFHGYTENFLRGYAKTVIDTFIIKNSISTDAIREGWNFYDTGGDGPAMNYVLFEDVTITNVGREAIQFGSAAVGYNPEVIINHVTMDSTSLTNDDRVIRMDGGTLYPTNAIITNCIMTNQMGSNSESVDLYGTSTISYTDTFNVRPVDTGESSSIGAGMIDEDPLYKDPSMGDYRLATNSPVRGAAENGTDAMGDRRWETDPGQFLLQVKTDGGGIVAVDPAGPFYDSGASVTLTADPDPGWKFDSWDGVLVFPPNNPVATVTMDGNKVVTAKFVDVKPRVTFSATAVGLGHVVLLPEPVEDTYAVGTEVTITAVSDSTTWAFVEWSGALSGSENPKTFKVDSAMDVTANFASTLTQFMLTFDVVGQGSIDASPEPVIDTYDTATVVELTAMPALGWEFTGWGDPLGGNTNPDTVQMDSNITLTVNFAEIMLAGGTLKIDTTWDLRDALEFANNNSQVDTIMLITSGGLYKTVSNSDMTVMKPLVVLAEPGLAEKPVIINAAADKSGDDIFRIFDDFTLMGVVLDGGHEMSHGPKYGIRLANNSSDTVKAGTDITVKDVDFYNFFQGKSLTADGHAFNIQTNIKAGNIHFEDCLFDGTGYEALRISDTEKWPTDGALESLTVRNCTFTNIDAECVRYYSDLDAATPDAPVLLEHLTIDNSATRVFYLKNSGGAIVRDIIISNSRTSGHGRDSDLMDAQGNTDIPSFVSHIDTFHVREVPIKAADGQIDSTTIFGYDPMYEDAENQNWTLMGGSMLYGISFSGLAIGDLNWADSTLSAVEDLAEATVPLRYSLEQNYPNPFNPSTKIKFSIKMAGKTTLKVYDVLGREVAVLIDKDMIPGTYEVDFHNTQLATGLYFYQIRSGNFMATKKMLMIK
jgi:hypothetical protein